MSASCWLVSTTTALYNMYVLYYCRLFEEHGELLLLFEKFRELRTKEDQVNSLELAEHASTVMNTLDEGIKGLDNLDAFFDYLHQVGASHRKIPNFKAEYFWVSYRGAWLLLLFIVGVGFIHN